MEGNLVSEPPHRDPIVLIVLGLVLLVALSLVWGTTMMPMMGPWMTGGWTTGATPWWGLLSPLFGLLVVGGLALIVVWALRRGDDTGGACGDERALTILKERYARGELSHEEYERMRRVLTGQE
jgi:putative membrane protein